MKLRNNNRKIIKELAVVNFKDNAGRNFILLITIVIAFVIILLTISMLNAYYQSQYIQNARIAGETSSLRLSNPTNKQIKTIENLPYIEKTATEIDLGYGQVSGVNNVRSLYVSNKSFKEQYVLAYTDIKGKYPEKQNEIMLSQRTLAGLGINNPELGMNIFIDHDGKNVFVLSGYFTDYSKGLSNAFFSKNYMGNMQGKIQKYLIIFDNLDSSVVNVKHKIEEDVKTDKNKQFITGKSFNLTYIINSDNSYGIFIILVFAILFCAVFLINSSLSVSMSKDCKTFALYKILGTTNAQMTALLTQQIAFISLIGVIIGVIVGSAFVLLIVPYLVESMYLMQYGSYPLSMCLSWMYYLISVPLVFLVPLLSSCIVMVKVSKIPPLQAMKVGKKSKISKVITYKFSSIINKMAIEQWIKGKSNFISIMTPLILSITIILCLSSWMNAVHWTEDETKESSDPDFIIMTLEYILDGNNTHYITSDMMQEISDLSGVAQVNVAYGDYFKLNAMDAAWQPLLKAYNKSTNNYGYRKGDAPYECAAIVLDNEKTREFEDYILKTNQGVNISKFIEGEGVICVNGSKLKKEQIREGEIVRGSEVNLSKRDMSVTNNFEFLGYVNVSGEQLNEFGNIAASYAMPRILISESGLKKMNSELYIHEMNIYVEQVSEPTIKKQINSIINMRNLDLLDELHSSPKEDYEYILFTSASDTLVLQERINNSVQIIIWGIGILLIILVMAQYFSVLLTNLTSREKELYTLNALGMTKSQIIVLLRREGLFFGIMCSILLVVFGSGIICLFNAITMLYQPYANIVFPWNEMFISVICIILLSIILPFIICKINKNVRNSVFR